MKVESSCDEELVNADGGARVRLICGINENISGHINHNGCGDIRRLLGRCGWGGGGGSRGGKEGDDRMSFKLRKIK